MRAASGDNFQEVNFKVCEQTTTAINDPTAFLPPKGTFIGRWDFAREQLALVPRPPFAGNLEQQVVHVDRYEPGTLPVSGVYANTLGIESTY